jgi:hypothetical protein
VSALTQAFYSKLNGDTTLKAMLATYSGAAAIFTQDPVPEAAPLPYVVTAGEVSDVPFDTKTKYGREFLRDVRCYAKNDGNPSVVEAIAERVRTLFHRQSLSVTGFNFLIASCSGRTADESDAYGRIVTVRLVLQNS